MSRRKFKKPSISTVFIIGIIAAIVYAIIVTINEGDYPGYMELIQGATAPAPVVATPFVPTITPPFVNGVYVTDVEDTQYLKLVNRDFAVTTSVCHSRLTAAWPTMAAASAYVMLHETAFYALWELFSHVEGTGLGGMFIASGYRNYDEQTRLYENALDQAYVSPPGHSEHHLGLAVDILRSGGLSMRDSEEARWLRENAPRFGLILRYPEHKQDITGVPYEPWHFRYVGRVHAWYMEKQDFVLEEYIVYLRNNGVLRTEFDGKTYYIFYQLPQNDMIFVPEDLNYLISSANTGGFIVTAWR